MPNKQIHLHLVSDSTGDTVRSVARATLAQFENAEVTEHFWSLVRSEPQVERVIEGVAANPGLVFCTMLNDRTREQLLNACRSMQVPAVSLLDGAMSALETVLSARAENKPGRQHAMDEAYFSRVAAMNFAMAHDDGQSLWSLTEADVILCGVSRTSKTPTCVYLANRGLKAANVPFVPEQPPPKEVLESKRPLVIGLTVDPTRLVQIRRHRMVHLNGADAETDYVDTERVQQEVIEARRYFLSKNWPVIDVTRRSIEETAAAIIQLHDKRKEARAADA
jgi:regulator of PEP synthase PpsR (kinase-PPPase family)